MVQKLQDIKSRLLEARAQQLLVAHEENKRWRLQALQYVERVRMEQALAVSIPPIVPNINQNPYLLNLLSFHQQQSGKSCSEKKKITSLDCCCRHLRPDGKKSQRVMPQERLKKVPERQKPPWALIKQQRIVPQNSELFDIVKSVTNAALKTRESILDLTAVVQQETQMHFQNLIRKIEQWLDAYPLQQQQSLAKRGQQRKLKRAIVEAIKRDRDANRREATRRFNEFLMSQSVKDNNMREVYTREFFRVVYGRYGDDQQQQQNMPVDLWRGEDGLIRDYVFRPQPVSAETEEGAICEFYSRLDEMNRFKDNLARIRFEPEIGQIYFRETKQPEAPILERDPHLWNNLNVRDLVVKTRAKCVETIVSKELLPGLLKLGGSRYHRFLLAKLMREPWVLYEGARVSLEYFLNRRQEDDKKIIREALVESALLPSNRLFVFSKYCFENLDVFARGHSYCKESMGMEERVHLLSEYLGYVFLHSSRNTAALETAEEWVEPAFSIWCLYPGLYLDLMHNLKLISRGQTDYGETLINSTSRLILQPPPSSSTIETDIALRINFAAGLVLTAPSFKEFVFSSHRQSLYFGRWITVEFQPDAVPDRIKDLYKNKSNNDDDDDGDGQNVYYAEKFYFDPDSLQYDKDRDEDFLRREQLTRALREAMDEQREDFLARALGRDGGKVFKGDNNENTFETPDWQQEAMSRFYSRLVGAPKERPVTSNAISAEGLQKLNEFSDNMRNLIREKYASDWVTAAQRVIKESLRNVPCNQADDMDTLKARIANESAANLYGNMLIGNTDKKFSTLLGYDDTRPRVYGLAKPEQFMKLSAYRPKSDAVVLRDRPNLIDLKLNKEDQKDSLTFSLPQEDQRQVPASLLTDDFNIAGTRYRNESMALERDLFLTKEKEREEAQRARALRNKLIQTSARETLGAYEMKIQQLLPPQPVPMDEDTATAAAAAATFSYEGISDQPRGAIPENVPTIEQYVRQLLEESEYQYRNLHQPVPPVPQEQPPPQTPRRRRSSGSETPPPRRRSTSDDDDEERRRGSRERRSRSPSRRQRPPSPFEGNNNNNRTRPPQRRSASYDDGNRRKEPREGRSRSPFRRRQSPSPFEGIGRTLGGSFSGSERPETDSNFPRNVNLTMLVHRSRGGNMPASWAKNPLALMISMGGGGKSPTSRRRSSVPRTRRRSSSPLHREPSLSPPSSPWSPPLPPPPPSQSPQPSPPQSPDIDDIPFPQPPSPLQQAATSALRSAVIRELQNMTMDFERLINLARNDHTDIFDNDRLKAQAVSFLSETAVEYFGADAKVFSASFNVNSRYIPMTLTLSEMVRYLAGLPTTQEGSYLAAESWLKVAAKIKDRDPRILRALASWNISEREFMDSDKYREIVMDISDKMDSVSTFLLGCIFGLPVEVRFSCQPDRGRWRGGERRSITSRANMGAINDTYFYYANPWDTTAADEQPLPVFVNDISHFAALGLRIFPSVQRELDFAAGEAEVGILYLLSVMVDVMRYGDMATLKNIFVNYPLNEFVLPSIPAMANFSGNIPLEDLATVNTLRIDQRQYAVGRVDGSGNCLWASLSVWFYGTTIYWPIIKFYTYKFITEQWDATIARANNAPTLEDLLEGLPFFAHADTEILKIVSALFRKPVWLTFPRLAITVSGRPVTFHDRLYLPDFSMTENPEQIPPDAVYLVLFSGSDDVLPNHYEPVFSRTDHVFYQPPCITFNIL